MAKKLNNGSRHQRDLVDRTMMQLLVLKEHHSILFLQLVLRARDPQHGMDRRSALSLMQLGMLYRDLTVPQLLKDVILSAVHGDDPEIGSPYAAHATASGATPAAPGPGSTS